MSESLKKFIPKINVIVEYSLYLLVFLLPIQTRLILRAGEINGGYLEYLTISLYGVDILLVLLLLFSALLKFQETRNPSRAPLSPPKGRADGAGKFQTNSKFPSFAKASAGRQIPKIWWIIGVLDVVIFISIFFAADIWLALYRYGLFLLGIGLFWLVVSANYSRIKLLWSLLAGLTLQAGLGTWQFLTQSSFASKWLGLALHEPMELGVSVVELITKDGFGERWLRAYGGLDHPNVLGGVLVIGLLLVVGLVMKRHKLPASAPSSAKASEGKKATAGKQIQNLILFTIYFLLFTAIFFTFSRTAWLAVVAGILAMLLLSIIKKNRFAQREILVIILVSSFLTFGLYSQYGDLVKTRFFGGTRLEIKSSSERIEYINEAKKLISQNWLFGAGIGNYSLAAKELDDNQKKDEGGKNYFLEARKQAWGFQPVHNVFLLVWAEVGIVGFLGLLGLMGYLGFLSWQRFRKSNDFISLPLLLALVIIMMFDHWLWSLHFGVLFFWLILGLLVKNNTNPQIHANASNK